MKNCFTICIDMDDTIENLLSAWISWLNKKYNYSVVESDVIEWGLDKHYAGLSHEEIFEPLALKEFWQTVQPKADAIEYINKLINEQQDIYIVTSAKYNTILPKVEEVLLKYFPMIDYHKIITIYDKQMLICDIMIDDNINNLIGGNYLRLLYDAPYNQNIDCMALQCQRVSSWKQIYDIIHYLDWFYTSMNKSTVDLYLFKNKNKHHNTI